MRFRIFAGVSMLALTIVFANGETPETRNAPDDALTFAKVRGMSIPKTPVWPNLGAQVDASCNNIPLREFLSNLAKQSNTKIVLDERKIANTQAALDKPLTMAVSSEISLKSTLSLALEPVHLGYYIKDGRIVVTSESFILSAPEPMIGPFAW